MPTRKLLIATLCLLAIEWILFKCLYPYPDVFNDSYSYVNVARDHLNLNLWPVGYSKFLAIFHAITHSSIALTTFQFFFLELSAFYLYQEIRSYQKINRATAAAIYIFFFVNPLVLYQSNTVTSDALFAAFSLLWITGLLKFTQKPPTWAGLWPQAILIGVGYTFRYTAMYYPILSALALFMSQTTLPKKIVGSLLFLLFLVPFIQFSKAAGKKLTGVPVYSILGDWQIANNALEMRAYINVDSTKLPTPECVKLDRISREYFQSSFNMYGPRFKELLDNFVGNWFVQYWNAPLKVYMMKTYGNSNTRSWALSGITFSQYGKYLVKTHPWPYLKYFILPNSKFYFLPPLSDIEMFNNGRDSINPHMQQWFNLKSLKIPAVSLTIQGKILFIFPILFFALNILFPALLLTYVVKHRSIDLPTLLITTFLLLNAFFTILANRACLRYEIFPMLIFWSFSWVVFDRLEVPVTSTHNKTPHSPSPSPHSPNPYTPG